MENTKKYYIAKTNYDYTSPDRVIDTDYLEFTSIELNNLNVNYDLMGSLRGSESLLNEKGNYLKITNFNFMGKTTTYWFITGEIGNINHTNFTYKIVLDVFATFGADVFNNNLSGEVEVMRMHADRWIYNNNLKKWIPNLNESAINKEEFNTENKEFCDNLFTYDYVERNANFFKIFGFNYVAHQNYDEEKGTFKYAFVITKDLFEFSFSEKFIGSNNLSTNIAPICNGSVENSSQPVIQNNTYNPAKAINFNENQMFSMFLSPLPLFGLPSAKESQLKNITGINLLVQEIDLKYDLGGEVEEKKDVQQWIYDGILSPNSKEFSYSLDKWKEEFNFAGKNFLEKIEVESLDILQLETKLYNYQNVYFKSNSSNEFKLPKDRYPLYDKFSEQVEVDMSNLNHRIKFNNKTDKSEGGFLNDEINIPLTNKVPATTATFNTYVSQNAQSLNNQKSQIELSESKSIFGSAFKIIGGLGATAFGVVTGNPLAIAGGVGSVISGGADLAYSRKGAALSKEQLKNNIDAAKEKYSSFTSGDIGIAKLKAENAIVFRTNIPKPSMLKALLNYHLLFGYELNEWRDWSDDLYKSREEFNFLQLKNFDNLLRGNKIDLPFNVIKEFSLLFENGIRLWHNEIKINNATKLKNLELKIINYEADK